MDEELDRFKRINLCEFAASQGYRLVRRETTRGGGTRGSTASSLLMRHPTTDDKIAVRLDRDGHWTYFSVRGDRDNGTIIDFVQRRGGRTLRQVREALREWSGQARAIPPILESRWGASGGQQGNRTAVAALFHRARVQANSPYLNGRGIRPETLTCGRFAGTWRVDERGDLLFPHRDGPGPENVCGFERKNATFAAFSAGGVKALWTSNCLPDDTRLVITEAVIDAFSYHQLHPDDRTRFASTSGAFGRAQARHIVAAIRDIPVGCVIVIATDNDEPGDRLAERLSALAGRARVERHRPTIGKDWNECLQRHERDYIRSLGLSQQSRGR